MVLVTRIPVGSGCAALAVYPDDSKPEAQVVDFFGGAESNISRMGLMAMQSGYGMVYAKKGAKYYQHEKTFAQPEQIVSNSSDVDRL